MYYLTLVEPTFPIAWLDSTFYFDCMPRGNRIEKVFTLIGKKIRSARSKTDLSQDDLAAKVKLERSSIVLIESGKQRLPIDRLYLVARELGTTPQKLLPEMKEIFEEADMENPAVTIHGGTIEGKNEMGKKILKMLEQQKGGGKHT